MDPWELLVSLRPSNEFVLLLNPSVWILMGLPCRRSLMELPLRTRRSLFGVRGSWSSLCWVMTPLPWLSAMERVFCWTWALPYSWSDPISSSSSSDWMGSCSSSCFFWSFIFLSLRLSVSWNFSSFFTGGDFCCSELASWEFSES